MLERDFNKMFVSSTSLVLLLSLLLLNGYIADRSPAARDDVILLSTSGRLGISGNMKQKASEFTEDVNGREPLNGNLFHKKNDIFIVDLSLSRTFVINSQWRRRD